MNKDILRTIESISKDSIAEERKALLEPLTGYIRKKIQAGQTIRLNFICTHNSRRSHLSQVWAQTMAHYFGIKDVFCYSGGTEATAMFPKVAETLAGQGFSVQKLGEMDNPVYAIKYAENEAPVICFSKEYSSEFNPKKEFGVIMTCNNADQGCPLVIGAEARFPIKYDDPKSSDGTPQQLQIYLERSLQIAAEMFHVFSQINR